MYVIHFRAPGFGRGPTPLWSLELHPLDGSRAGEHFAGYSDASRAQQPGGDVYEVLLETKGAWREKPTHAVYAAWHLTNTEYAKAFVERARNLFGIRARVLSSFACDWLLKRPDREGEYLVLGVYGTEEGATRDCREHPEIAEFLKRDPADAYTANSPEGMRCFRIVEQRGGEGRDGNTT